jgi:N-acetylglucosaminyl-diphospho-decaprenol L-rhamnosyltransferase
MKDFSTVSVFISVVSHGHGDLIEKLSCLSNLAKEYHVVVKLNTEEQSFVSYLENHKIKYINDNYGLGFGHNNNIVYSYCSSELNMNREDVFVVLNPDVVCTVEEVESLVFSMDLLNSSISCVNLFKDNEHTIPDNSIRSFPTLLQFVKSFLGLGNPAVIEKNTITQPINVDWAAGSFLAFKAYHYFNLKGFDERYFMYCEDIDICYRSKQLGMSITFFPNIKMQHLAEHANRTILSKHFYWHVVSVCRFILSKHCFTKTKSSIR